MRFMQVIKIGEKYWLFEHTTRNELVVGRGLGRKEAIDLAHALTDGDVEVVVDD